MASATASRPAPTQHAAGASRPGQISVVGWQPNGPLDQRQWLLEGKRLGAISRCSPWCIGDWIRYGESRWGETYTEPARITGHDPKTLRNYAWVARSVDLSLRRDNLTFSHHELVASLTPDEQRRWLDVASENRMSVDDLRLALRTSRREQHDASDSQSIQEDDASDGETDSLRCSHCGGVLPYRLIGEGRVVALASAGRLGSSDGRGGGRSGEAKASGQ